jgi:hypothetical protein
MSANKKRKSSKSKVKFHVKKRRGEIEEQKYEIPERGGKERRNCGLEVRTKL